MASPALKMEIRHWPQYIGTLCKLFGFPFFPHFMLRSISLIVMGFLLLRKFPGDEISVYIYVSYSSSDQFPGASELSVQRPH